MSKKVFNIKIEFNTVEKMLSDKECCEGFKELLIEELEGIVDNAKIIAEVVDKDQQIAELKAKVKELEEENKLLKVATVKGVTKREFEVLKENKQLKEKLKAQPKQIVEEIKNYIHRQREEEKFKFSEYHEGKEFAFMEINDFLDNLLKKYGGKI